MSEYDNKPYEVSFIASAPEELKVGDRVEIVTLGSEYKGLKGIITTIKDNVFIVDFGDDELGFREEALRKIPDTTSFLRKDNPFLFEEDSDNVKAFKAVLNEMAETYKAKDATYGNAYQDGFNRFGAVQLVSRMYEKYCRIENLLVRNADNKVPDESVIDTITDLGVQCVVLRMLLQKNDFENVV